MLPRHFSTVELLAGRRRLHCASLDSKPYPFASL
jgi:hypothetical protein